MPKTKSMQSLLQPLSIDFELDSKNESSHVAIDGSKTKMFTKDGKLSQNALALMVHIRVEKKKYEKLDKALASFLLKEAQARTPVQEGDYLLSMETKATSGTSYVQPFDDLLQILFKDDQAKKDEWKAKTKTASSKTSLLINGNKY